MGRTMVVLGLCAVGAYRDVPTLWGVRRVWNTSAPDEPALARSFAITLYCQAQ